MVDSRPGLKVDRQIIPFLRGAENLYKNTFLVLLVHAPVNAQPLREICAQYFSSKDRMREDLREFARYRC